MSACTSKTVRSPNLSLPSWSTRRNQIVLVRVSACFPLPPLGAMMRVVSGGVEVTFIRSDRSFVYRPAMPVYPSRTHDSHVLPPLQTASLQLGSRYPTNATRKDMPLVKIEDSTREMK